MNSQCNPNSGVLILYLHVNDFVKLNNVTGISFSFLHYQVCVIGKENSSLQASKNVPLSISWVLSVLKVIIINAVLCNSGIMDAGKKSQCFFRYFFLNSLKATSVSLQSACFLSHLCFVFTNNIGKSWVY